MQDGEIRHMTDMGIGHMTYTGSAGEADSLADWGWPGPGRAVNGGLGR